MKNLKKLFELWDLLIKKDQEISEMFDTCEGWLDEELSIIWGLVGKELGIPVELQESDSWNEICANYETDPVTIAMFIKEANFLKKDYLNAKEKIS